MNRKIISVLVECDGHTFRVIDNLKELVEAIAPVEKAENARHLSEEIIGRKVLDLALEIENKP
jgi:hypothetical protein